MQWNLLAFGPLRWRDTAGSTKKGALASVSVTNTSHPCRLLKIFWVLIDDVCTYVCRALVTPSALISSSQTTIDDDSRSRGSSRSMPNLELRELLLDVLSGSACVRLRPRAALAWLSGASGDFSKQISRSPRPNQKINLRSIFYLHEFIILRLCKLGVLVVVEPFLSNLSKSREKNGEDRFR